MYTIHRYIIKKVKETTIEKKTIIVDVFLMMVQGKYSLIGLKLLDKNKRSPFLTYIGIASLFIALIFAVSPLGEFLTDDDWAYAKSVEYLFKSGELKILNWSPMSLVFHTITGALASYLFGFSFTVLKLSTIFLSFICTVSVFILFKEVTIDNKNSIVSSMLLVFNPIYFFLTFTFMTDIPFLTWFFMSVLFYYKGEKDDNFIYTFLGSLFAAFSILIRQNGILIPFSIILYYLTNMKYHDRLLKKIMVSALLPGITFIIFEYWYFNIHGPVTMYFWHQDHLVNSIKNPIILIEKFFDRLIKISLYCGMFLIPLSASLLPSFNKMKPSRKNIVSIAIVSILLILWVVLQFSLNNTLMPYLINKITSYGIMSSNELFMGDRMEIIPKHGWITITILSLISLIVIIYIALVNIKTAIQGENRGYNILIFSFIIQLLYLLIVPNILYDRYIIILLPLCVIGVISNLKYIKVNIPIYTLAIIPIAIFSIITTKEVNSFSRSVWEAGNYLVKEEAVPLMHIDGGFAWDGWNMFEFSEKYQIDNSKKRDPWWIRSIAPAIESKYIISLSEKINSKEFSYINDEYTVKKQFNYKSFFNEPLYVYILKRIK